MKKNEKIKKIKKKMRVGGQGRRKNWMDFLASYCIIYYYFHVMMDLMGLCFFLTTTSTYFSKILSAYVQSNYLGGVISQYLSKDAANDAASYKKQTSEEK